MVDKKNCSGEVIASGNSNSSRGASFSSDGGNDREALEKDFLKLFFDNKKNLAY